MKLNDIFLLISLLVGMSYPILSPITIQDEVQCKNKIGTCSVPTNIKLDLLINLKMRGGLLQLVLKYQSFQNGLKV